jgi:hypothetical protein
MKKRVKKIPHEKKSTASKFIWSSGEKYRLFVWDKNISKALVILLILSVIILAMLTYTQNLYIKQLEYKSNYFQNENVKPLVIPLDDFVEENNLEGAAISNMAEYFQSNGYELEIATGVLQASKKECESSTCVETVYRYNQKKGLYLDMYQIETRNK